MSSWVKVNHEGSNDLTVQVLIFEVLGKIFRRQILNSLGKGLKLLLESFYFYPLTTFYLGTFQPLVSIGLSDWEGVIRSSFQGAGV